MFKRIALGIIASICFAAAAQAQPAPVFNWSGYYVGGTIGYGDGGYSHRNDLNGISTRDLKMNGFVGGITAGYIWQARGSSLVLGLETDFSFSAVKGADDDPAWGCGVELCTASVKWFGTVRPRVGVVHHNALFFVTGGLAYGDVKATSGAFLGGVEGSSELRTGWTAGAGIELALSPRWSAKLEYLHIDLGSFVYKFNGPSPISIREIEFDVVRLGVNYRF